MTGPAPRPASRRSVLAAAALAAAGAALPAAPAGAAPSSGPGPAPLPGAAPVPPVDNRFWTSAADWASGSGRGVRVTSGCRAGLVLDAPVGTAPHTDPHTGRTAAWEYATWTSPRHTPALPATEVVASWNADTPAGTWITVELCCRYPDGADSPWYVMGRWAAGDADIRRTSVDGQGDGRSSVWTDTLAVKDRAGGPRVESYRLRLTLHRAPGSGRTPTVRRLGAMASALPDRFTVPPAPARVARELPVPRYSQNVHAGRYPEYDNGGEAWCSPTASQMVVEFWGRRPTPAQLSWVRPEYTDPQVCHAARATYDHQYAGCGNWPFNAAYAATYEGLNGVVTRLGSLADAEALVEAGIPVITSQSFLAHELPGAGYGTAGHLMAVTGFTADGDVVANDPGAPDNARVRRVYPRRAFENVWLRTRRRNTAGTVVSGTGGVCYLYWPDDATAAQLRALAAVGVR